MNPFIEQLANEGFQVTRLGHAYRINGVVDIWNNGAMVYDLPANKYHKIYDSKTTEELVREILATHPKRDPFKKTTKGRMTMQEFRNNQWNRSKA